MREKEYFSGCSQHPQRGCDLPDYVPYLDVSEKTKFIKYLTRQGATIEDLNTIRARLSQVKGGKLLSAAKGAAFVHTFILSDIINNPGKGLDRCCLGYR